eukprot:6152911-Karenia_brevis.AAC.1
MMHVLNQVGWNYISAMHTQKKDANCQMLPLQTEDGRTIDFLPVIRGEFQDGKRKPATQAYHGSGRPHQHGIGWGDDPETWQLQESV